MGKKDNKYSNAATSLSEGGIFGLGRPIDFTDGITRIALICTILTSVAATFWKTMGGADTETAMYFGLNTAAAFFFSWLIAQELDPDRKLGGIIGGGLSIVAAAVLSPKYMAVSVSAPPIQKLPCILGSIRDVYKRQTLRYKSSYFVTFCYLTLYVTKSNI